MGRRPRPTDNPQNAHVTELKQRLELAQLLAEIGVQADIPQQDELFRFVKAGFSVSGHVCHNRPRRD